MAPVTAKIPKEAKAKKTISAATKKPKAHPPYSEMINEAITGLKERTGSSQFAIAKFMEEKQKTNLPNNFKKLLLVQLKKLVANGKLVKVKNSFKLPPKASSITAAMKKPKPSAATAAAAKKPIASSTTAAATKKPKSNSTAAAAEKPKASSTTAAATKKPKSKPKTKKASVNSIQSPAKKAVVAVKAKKPKSLKTPVKKSVAKKGKN